MTDTIGVMKRELRVTAVTASLGGAATALYGLAALNGWFQVPSERVAVEAARTLASTGASPAGAMLPLFIHVRDTLWLQPIPIYLMALTLKLSGGASAAPRLITAVVAAVDVALTYVVARRLFRRDRTAVMAAALLLLTPAHLLYGSTAAAPLYSVPFVLLWLLALFPDGEDARGPRLFAATAVLGLGVYTNPEAVWTMAAYAVVTMILLARGRSIVLAAAGFTVALLPAVSWFLVHPRTYVDTMGSWAVHPAYIRNPIDGIAAFFRYDVFARRVSLYWDFFSPRHLFFAPQAPGLEWTGGVLLWPLVLLLPLGLYRLTYGQPRTPRTATVVWGFFIAPVAAAAFDQPRSIAGALALLPFATMLGAAGIEALLERPWVHWARRVHEARQTPWIRTTDVVTASEKRQTPELR